MNKVIGCYSPDEIFDLFNAFPEVENDFLKSLITISLSKLNMNLVNKILEKVIFLCCDENMYGTYINRKTNRYKNKDLILLNAHMITQFDEAEQIRIVLHEVAHFYLKHKNFTDYESPDQYDLNEVAADKQVNEWLNTR